MELPDDAPKLPKLPFLIGDVIFLGITAYLINQAGSTPSTASIVGIVVSAGIAVGLGLAPFIVGYARQQDQQLTERQNALEALTRTTASAADQACIAANGLHEIAEITKRNLHSIEELPAAIEAARQSAKSKENHQHATAVEALRSDLDQVREEQASAQESTTQLLEKLAEQLTALETQVSQRFAELETHLDQVPSAPPPPAIAPAPAPKPTAALAPDPEPEPEPEPEDLPPAAPVVEPEPEPEPEPEIDHAEEPTAEPAPTPEPAKPAPKKKAKTKKAEPKKKPTPPPEPSLFDPVAEPDEDAENFDDEEDLVLASDEPAPAEEVSEEPDDALEPDADEDLEEEEGIDDEPPAPSSDGITRLTVTAYIGIGNRLFVRGDGPGLSRDEGTPLQFVSIGKWRWESDAATEPVKLTIWKNDETECTALGEIELPPGAQLETSANF
ncbi:hypothetical protein [Actomonas aquatica]|uniref:Uncharacterized protein n=1 Tax=Actomonas aquatica TaxID=2866162 RepID=A0ABZ1CAK0_9BACT|nr:hypothetical protein [Opitutus sp. WL0086]WRQ88566.1 hypothetical protein K1X11_004065 [Opitutus sp. WL0086]